MSERITFRAISEPKLKKMKDDGEEVCFKAKGKTICAPIKSVNQKTVTVITGGVKYRVSHQYSSLIPKKDWKEDYTPKKKFVSTPSSDENYNKSREARIKPIPQSKLNSIHNSVKKMAKCLNDMREIKKKCTLSQAMCTTGFNNGRECAEKNAQEITDKLNKHYKLPMNKVIMKGTRPKTSRGGDLYGDYTYPSGKIRVFPYTKGRLNKETGERINQQVIANKKGIETLIHEWNHHYDHRGIKLSESIHTAGFGIRTSTIYNQLKSVLD